MVSCACPSGAGARCSLNGWLRSVAALLCCVAGSLPAAAQNALPSGAALQGLLVRMKTNMAKNGLLAEQYTYVEDWHNLNFDRNGKKTADESAKYENVFVEGLPYQRKVEEDGKPLTGKAAAREEQRYEKAVDERKHMTPDQKRGFFHRTSHTGLPIDYLTTLFDNRVTREVMLNGRKTYVVESVPKPDAKSTDAQERTALCWKETTWIDEADEIPAQLDAVALENVAHMKKGMRMRVTWEQMEPSPEDKSGQPVWVEKQYVGQGQVKWFFFSGRARTEQDYSDYRKFQVDVRLLPDSVKMMTASQNEEHP
jgi:hypothetical protein